MRSNRSHPGVSGTGVPPSPRTVRSRRAAALVMAVLMLAAVNLAVISAINGGGDDARLASTRADTVRAFYAAESGAALVVGEYNAGRAVPTGTFTISPGATAVISSSASTIPMDVVILGKFGQAQRRIELRVE